MTSQLFMHAVVSRFMTSVQLHFKKSSRPRAKKLYFVRMYSTFYKWGSEPQIVMIWW